ncbi:MAG: hypothetical protein IPJ61_05015 [Tessaracoccus sp.]|uniref:hypothetical protein n=1 Tax=Tessaracoccus sp. TaxID=1971211 RepID=UPI001EB2AFC6|nr:hypothetical protein [Tessaracoccus sp.]MBK7820436.1 hypothetical protein [Tessaracoccus sp.]
MLYLNPPYYTIDGVTLMPDHEDPLQYYYMPMSPHVSIMKEGDLKIPKIQVIKFTGRPTPTSDIVSGGFLDFDCNIGIDSERLAAIGDELRGLAGLRDAPRLAPVPLIGGTVRMMLFGKESPKEETGLPGRRPEETLPGPQFVQKIVHAASPSLYGDNQAAFSVRLDQEGVTILDQAIRDEMLPIGVVYSLEYVGLRPAYKIKVEADWDRVQKHFEETESVNVPLIASETIEKVIDELVEKQYIKIEGDLLVADEDDTGGASGRYESVMAQVRELVFENFFQPSLEPIERQHGDAIDDFGRVMRTLATHGMSSVWERKETDITRIDRKKLNIDMSERTSVIREIHPQGHLPGIIRSIESQGLQWDRFISEVSLEDPFFQRRTVRVIPRADFTTDQIEAINVRLDYNGSVKNVILDNTTREQSVEWQSTVTGGRVLAPVDVSYDVLFSSAATGRPRSITAGPESIDGDVIQIAPRDGAGYELRWISFTVTGFPWELYPTIEVHCRYEDPDNGIRISNQYGLTQAQNSGAWPVFALDPTRRTVGYRLILHGTDGRTWDSGDLETDDDQIRISDPFGTRRTVDIVAPAAMFGTQVDRAFIDVSYEDLANNVRKRESFELSAADPATKRFVVELVDPARRRVTYKVSLLRTDGIVVDIPESTTEQDRIFVSAQMRGHRTIAVTTDGVNLAANGIRHATVETLYERPTLGLRFADSVTLTTDSPRDTIEYDYADGDPAISYRVIHTFDNGLTRQGPWTTTSGDVIVARVD